MDIPNDIPKYRKRSKKKGLTRSKHKHAYENCVFWQHERILDEAKGFIFGPGIKYSIGTYCPVCGKIGTTYDKAWTVSNKDSSIVFATIFKTDWNEAAKREFDPKARTLPCFQLNDGEFMQKFIQEPDYDIDLLIKCAKDLGASVTPGTGKLFVNGKEMSVSEALDLGFSSDLQKELYDRQE